MIAVKEKPTLKPLEQGIEFKSFEVTGKTGMEMPPHISTGEAVVVIRKGSAALEMDGKVHEYGQGAVFIIPANKVHSLSIKSDFNAVVLMSSVSNIKFK